VRAHPGLTATTDTEPGEAETGEAEIGTAQFPLGRSDDADDAPVVQPSGGLVSPATAVGLEHHHPPRRNRRGGILPHFPSSRLSSILLGPIDCVVGRLA
jgi:hypothetical protein